MFGDNFFNSTQMSSLLGSNQAFPLDSVWGSEDHCCGTSHMPCILFLFPTLEKSCEVLRSLAKSSQLPDRLYASSETFESSRSWKGRRFLKVLSNLFIICFRYFI